MTSQPRAWVSDALRGFRRTYEASGMRFYVDPPPELVPDFLAGFRPDAIARGPEGGVIIEVTEERSPASDRQIAELARKVSGEKGWEFRAVHARPPSEPVPSIVAPTADQIAAALREAEALLASGHEAAALVAAWAVLVSLARLASDADGPSHPRALSALGAVQALAEEGILDSGTTHRLVEAAGLRNAIVHGDLSAQVPREEVVALLDDLRGIAHTVVALRRTENLSRDADGASSPSAHTGT